MKKDTRIKGCPNEQCEMHIERKKQDSANDYCPKCGAKLTYVCAKCFREIEDTPEKYKICLSCYKKAKEKKQRKINQAKHVAGKAKKIVAPAAIVVLDKAAKKGGAIGIGAQVAEEVAKAVLKN